MVTHTDLLTILTFLALGLIAAVAFAIWRLLKTIEKLSNRVDESLKQFEMTAEEIRRTNSVFYEIMSRWERGVANVEHVTEGVRKFRKTLDAATGVLDFAVIPVLGTTAGVLAGLKAASSHVVNRMFRKEGRHGK